MQSRPPSVVDQYCLKTSFGSKHSDEDGDDLEDKEFVTVIKIGSATTQSEVPGLNGILVIKTERSTFSYSFLFTSSALMFSIFTPHSSLLLSSCCPCPINILFCLALLSCFPFLIKILSLLLLSCSFSSCFPCLPSCSLLALKSFPAPLLPCCSLSSLTCPFDIFILLLSSI